MLEEAIGRLPERVRAALIVLGDGTLRKRVDARRRESLGTRFPPQGFVNQSQLGQYFLAADVFVLASHHETWGLVVNEAMQFGQRVVVGDRAGCQEDLLMSSEAGYVFPDVDAKALTAVLRKSIPNPDTAMTSGRNARERMRQFANEASVHGVFEALRSQPA